MLYNANKPFFDERTHSLEEHVSVIDRFDGMDYVSVLDLMKSVPQSTILKENTIERTWIEDGYSVCLLFDEQDICLGVWEEHKK